MPRRAASLLSLGSAGSSRSAAMCIRPALAPVLWIGASITIACGGDTTTAGDATTADATSSSSDESGDAGEGAEATAGDGDGSSGDGDGSSGDGDGDGSSGDGDGSSGDGDGSSGDGDGSSGDGDGSSGDGDGDGDGSSSGDGDGSSGDGDGSSGDGDGTTTGLLPGDCGWDAMDMFYECGFDGAEEPTSTYPYACPAGIFDDGPCNSVMPQGCCDTNGDLFWCDASTSRLHFVPCAGCMPTGSVCTDHAQCCSGGCLATTGRCT